MGKKMSIMPSALKQAMYLGVEEPLKNNLLKMLKVAAPYSVSPWTHRYNNWVFQIERNALTDIGVLNEKEGNR